MLTAEEIKQVVDQAEAIKTRVDDQNLTKKELKKMIAVLEELL